MPEICIHHISILRNLWKTTDNKYILLVWIHLRIAEYLVSDSFAWLKNKDFRISSHVISACSKKVNDTSMNTEKQIMG